jgi:hypothetical protein
VREHTLEEEIFTPMLQGRNLVSEGSEIDVENLTIFNALKAKLKE